ncbi:hypothetical protein [Plectonema radiosum]|uniref:hypothetical protein n=1 Tax=Plectonema radiosum TaxID=945768 RepID=UPI001D1508F6|nr:hypothetical protein [Plectonema radiosum]
MIATFFVCFWVFLMLLFSLSVVRAFKQGAEQIKKLHQIPCYKCDFFTNDYRLKCTVNPTLACSEEAYGCIDFEPKKVSKNTFFPKAKSNLFHLSETELQDFKGETNN